MKSGRFLLLVVAVIPGFLIAAACAVLFISDLNAYLAIPAQSQQLTSMYDATNSGSNSALSTVFGQGLRTLLRINLFESGAGVALGLILAAIGINGICQLSAKEVIQVVRESEQPDVP
jgi:hypothetical protein